MAPGSSNHIKLVQQFASVAHGTQWRKFADEPYINHPVRVMEICAAYSKDEAVLAAALLHDVIEDTTTSSTDIQGFLDGFMPREQSLKITQLVIELTDVYVKENYPSWNRRKRKQQESIRMSTVSADAQTIKYADILDNLGDIMNAGDEFATKYVYECRSLLQYMRNGNASLRNRVNDAIKNALSLLKGDTGAENGRR
ncbi:MAG: bifunctional (p)ppGpp synthetase/guanosine-3',5'-bis(diphosphate) 3'-pyrophosphohydrolase [Chitinophagaceae bacterium]|nr:MAG: bifunctional (p)ppGpp synthetase/guanosine-3',5'-bis(diphosphate) 3'-pyrophosphohydrolase [Chitinophagaceae bacterium]